MLLLGVELQDILRVVVGIALGLLTVYRRELSCNRGYHPDDDDDENDAEGSRYYGSLSERGKIHTAEQLSSHDGRNIHIHSSSRTGLIRRRKSSSALPNMIASVHQDDEHHRIHNVTASSSSSNKNNTDATEELLESAGLSLSGGPFLYMFIAMIDHLVLSTYLSTWASVSSVLHRLKSKVDVRQNSSPPPSLHHEKSSRLHSESRRHDESDAIMQQQKHQHLYSVAWNAATEYFTSISAKLDTTQQQHPIRNHPFNNTRHSTNNIATPRSKSTGNLHNLSSDSITSRALFREMLAMANNGGFDVTLLPSDAQIVIFSYLPPKDILSFTCTNRAGRCLLDDGYEGEELSSASSGGLHYSKHGDTPLLIWKALFHRDYSWVLTDWKVGKDAFLKSMNNYLHHDDEQQQQQQVRHFPKSRKIFHHLISMVASDSTTVTTWPTDRMPEDASATATPIHSLSSMKEFYFTFAESWLNYTIAGCNSPNTKCLIGLHGHVFDITHFVEDHPGSTETLLLQSGRDATVFFESMGHSLGARKLALGMCVVVNGQCIRWDAAVNGSGDGDLFPRNNASGRLSHFAPCGLVKPTHESLASRKDVLGFLIPRRRSLPRFQGGLHRIRERLRQEEERDLHRAARWGNVALGMDGMFGGVHVYFDPFCGWRWWYTDREFNVVFVTPPRPS